MKRMTKWIAGIFSLVLMVQMALVCVAASPTEQEYQEEGDIFLTHTSEKAFSSELYATDATGAYAGYRQLHGYPGEDKFSIYFQDSYSGSVLSFQTTYEDLRGINLNETITWSYNGVSHVNTRLELYNMMYDTAHLSSILAITDRRVFSHDWFRNTFGQVYIDWITGGCFSQDATRLTEKFLNKENGIVYGDRFASANYRVHFDEEDDDADSYVDD